MKNKIVCVTNWGLIEGYGIYVLRKKNGHFYTMPTKSSLLRLAMTISRMHKEGNGILTLTEYAWTFYPLHRNANKNTEVTHGH